MMVLLPLVGVDMGECVLFWKGGSRFFAGANAHHTSINFAHTLKLKHPSPPPHTHLFFFLLQAPEWQVIRHAPRVLQRQRGQHEG